MTKNVFMQVVALVNGQTVEDMDALRDAINAELDHMSAKAQGNREMYALAHDVAMSVINDHPMTAKEIFTEGGNDWPDGFTANKLQYALLHYWNDEVNKVDNGKSANTYVKR